MELVPPPVALGLVAALKTEPSLAASAPHRVTKPTDTTAVAQPPTQHRALPQPASDSPRSSSAGSTITHGSYGGGDLSPEGSVPPEEDEEEGEDKLWRKQRQCEQIFYDCGSNDNENVYKPKIGGGDGKSDGDLEGAVLSSDGASDCACSDNSDFDTDLDNKDHSALSPYRVSTLRLSASDETQGITVDVKTNMKVDKYDYRKSKDGKEGNALRAHNPLMRIMPSPVPGRMGTASIPYPPYIGKKRDEEDGTESVPTSGLYFKIGPKVHEYNCVRNSWLRAGFVRTNSWDKAAGYWGRHCSASTFRDLNRWQKVNHFPGSWIIGRKDRLGRIMGRMRRKFGADFSIHAETMVMPMDRRKLANLISAEPKALWIIKPASSSCGRGIRVVSSQTCNPKKLRKGTIVQRYLSKPYLIDGRKFDMRIYIIVTCYDPLRAYICEEGLVRFATGKYSRSLKSLKNRFVHLTNYSVNKNSDEFVKPTSNAEGNGVEQTQAASKWTLTHLLKYFRENGIDDGKVLDDIKDCCVKTLISAEPHIASLVHQLHLTRTNCFEVFGFDVFLDHKLKPWLIEVNVSPSLSSSSPLDKRIKNKLLCDTFHLVGFKPYDHHDESRFKEQTNSERLHHGTSSRLRPNTSSRPASRKTTSRNVLQLKSPGILSNLSEEDMEVLFEMEEELSRKGDLTRIYPSDDPNVNAYYSQFFECARYNNTLVNMWIESRGINSLTLHPKQPSAPSTGSHRSCTMSRPERSHTRTQNCYPSLVERQGLSRNRDHRSQRRQQQQEEEEEGTGSHCPARDPTRFQQTSRQIDHETMKKAITGGFEVVQKDLQEEQKQRDRAWDRDWDRAHGHYVSESDEEEVYQEGVINNGGRRGETAGISALVAESDTVARVASPGVNSKSGHISRLQQRRLEIEQISRDHENGIRGSVCANTTYATASDILTPRAQMAKAILDNACSDFEAIQQAMRAVAVDRAIETMPSSQASKIRLRSGQDSSSFAAGQQNIFGRSSANRTPSYRAPRSSYNTHLEKTDTWQDGYYDQRFSGGHGGNRHKHQYVKQRCVSPRSDGSMNPNTQPQTKFTALAPGRDAVLAYQQRQYRKKQKDWEQRSKKYQNVQQKQVWPHCSTRGTGVEQLASEVKLSGISMPLQHHSSFDSTSSNSHAAWVQARRPRYR